MLLFNIMNVQRVYMLYLMTIDEDVIYMIKLYDLLKYKTNINVIYIY